MSEHSGGGEPSALALYKLANVWHLRGRPDRAALGYEAALRADPGFVPAYLELAELLLRAGRRDEAIAVYRRGSSACPDDPSLRGRLAALSRENEPHRADYLEAVTYPCESLAESGTPHVLLYTDCGGVYGAGRFNHLLACGLRKAGYRVTCAQSLTSDPLILERGQLGVAHVTIPAEDQYHPGFRIDLGHRPVEQARRLFALLRPDVILFSDGSQLSHLAAKQAAVESAVPYVVIVHLPRLDAGPCGHDGPPPWPELCRRSRAVVVVSQTSLELLEPDRNLRGAPTSVIINAVPESFFEPPVAGVRQRVRQGFGVADDAVLVLTTARMEIPKGYQHQIAAMKQLRNRLVWPRLCFAWAGTGTYEPRLRVAVIEAGAAGHVRFLGERLDTRDLLDAADVFVLSSEHEGMSVSVMEAMARQLPVIATAVGGMADALGGTGRLLPAPKPDPVPAVDLLARTLEEWACDRDLRRNLGRACGLRARELFVPQRMVNEYAAVIQQILQP